VPVTEAAAALPALSYAVIRQAVATADFAVVPGNVGLLGLSGK